MITIANSLPGQKIIINYHFKICFETVWLQGKTFNCLFTFFVRFAKLKHRSICVEIFGKTYA